VLRIFGQTSFQRSRIWSTGFLEDGPERPEEVAEAPHGIFFLTGPTGCGKNHNPVFDAEYLNQPGPSTS